MAKFAYTYVYAVTEGDMWGWCILATDGVTTHLNLSINFQSSLFWKCQWRGRYLDGGRDLASSAHSRRQSDIPRHHSLIVIEWDSCKDSINTSCHCPVLRDKIFSKLIVFGHFFRYFMYGKKVSLESNAIPNHLCFVHRYLLLIHFNTGICNEPFLPCEKHTRAHRLVEVLVSWHLSEFTQLSVMCTLHDIKVMTCAVHKQTLHRSPCYIGWK